MEGCVGQPKLILPYCRCGAGFPAVVMQVYTRRCQHRASGVGGGSRLSGHSWINLYRLLRAALNSVPCPLVWSGEQRALHPRPCLLSGSRDASLWGTVVSVPPKAWHVFPMLPPAPPLFAQLGWCLLSNVPLFCAWRTKGPQCCCRGKGEQKELAGPPSEGEKGVSEGFFPAASACVDSESRTVPVEPSEKEARGQCWDIEEVPSLNRAELYSPEASCHHPFLVAWGLLCDCCSSRPSSFAQRGSCHLL